MKLSILPIVLLAACSGSRSAGQPTSSILPSDPPFAALDTFMAELHAAGLTPGFAIVIIKNDSVRYAKGFGVADIETGAPITPQSVFYIASVTKSLIGLTAAILANENLLHLDAPVSRYVRLPLRAPLSGDSITSRMLLTHTHGIDNYGPIGFVTSYLGSSEARIIALVAEHPAAETGRGYVYGNIGYNLAGTVITAAAREPWKHAVDRRVLRPLGMTSTTAMSGRADKARLVMPHLMTSNGFRKLPYLKMDSSMHAAGGYVASPLDLATFLRAHMNDGVVNGRQVLARAAVSESKRPQVEMEDSARWYRPFAYGFGWEIGRFGADTLLLSTGGFAGFAAHMSYIPARKIGLIVLVNEGTYGGLLGDVAARGAYAILTYRREHFDSLRNTLKLYPERLKRRRATLQARVDRINAARPLSLPITAYTGTFMNPVYGQMHVTQMNGVLNVQLGALQSAAEVRTAGADTVRVELVPGQGENILFSAQNQRVDSLRYQGRVFKRD